MSVHMQLFCLLVIVVIASCNVDVNDELNPCQLAGGTCRKSDTCNKDIKMPEEYKKLCPDKAEHCCNDVADAQKRCKTYGGECIKNCPDTVIKSEGTDCNEGLSCCVWLT